MSKIILAYSGGLDTSVILRWLLENYRAEVVALYVDLGQKDNVPKVRDKALKTGAAKFYAVDCREEFVRDFIFPALRMNARYEDLYLMGTSLARPLIAKQMVAVARREKADSVAHGATGKGNDQVRFELTCMALAPKLKVIAPWREWNFTSRGDLVAYAKRHKIPVPVTAEKPYSSDANLMHVSYEGGILEDPWREPDEKMFQMTVSPERAPDRAETVTVSFRQGNPTAVNGKRLRPAKLLDDPRALVPDREWELHHLRPDAPRGVVMHVRPAHPHHAQADQHVGVPADNGVRHVVHFQPPDAGQ